VRLVCFATTVLMIKSCLFGKRNTAKSSPAIKHGVWRAFQVSHYSVNYADLINILLQERGYSKPA
jgi:hypothetical protein